MGNLPLHPAIVHIPLGLAFILPLLAIGLGIALWRGGLPQRAWAVVVGLQAVLLAGGLMAMSSGEREEERVERVVGEQRLEAHEALAEQFVWGAGIVLAVAAAGLVLKHRGVMGASILATTAGTLVVAGLAMRVGHSGGELVYKHGAASSYVSGAGAAPGGGALGGDGDGD